MRRKPEVRALDLVLALALGTLVAGCGGGGGDAVPEPSGPASITVTSTAFRDGDPIPSAYTCRGGGAVPPLRWRGVPASASAVAVVVSDPDAPRGTFVHWVVYDLPAGDGGITDTALPPGARQARNGAGKRGWYAPCPPSGTHHYRFSVYAVTGRVDSGGTTAVLRQLAERAVAHGTLVGTVTR